MARARQSQVVESEQTGAVVPTRPAIHLSNCKKGGVGKTLLSKLKAAYCLEAGLDCYAVDADRQESFIKAYRQFVQPTRFSELDRHLKIQGSHSGFGTGKAGVAGFTWKCRGRIQSLVECRRYSSSRDRSRS